MRDYFPIFGRGRPLRIAITITCQMAFILFGYDQGVFSGIVGNDDWLTTFTHPTGSLEGIIVAIYNLGAFSGSLLNLFTAERLGRRKSMWFAMAFIIVGAVLQASSSSLAQLLVARYITGIGTGIETSTVPMYQSELCEAHKRGRLVASEPLFVGVGIVIAYFFDFGMGFVGGPISWRLPLACQIIFALLVVALVFGLPESPRYLSAKGHSSAALAVLSAVHDRPPSDPAIAAEHASILAALALHKHGASKWHHLFRPDRLHTPRRVALAYGTQFMQQMSGINLVVYYVPTALAASAGLSPTLAQAVGGTVQSMFFFGSLVPTFFLDRMGRRAPMLLGAAGCAASMLLIAVLTVLRERGNDAAGVASIAFFFTYMGVFGATLNCIPWVYAAEVLPLRARAGGVALATSANWLFNFVVVMVAPSALQTLGGRAYLIFMALNLAFVPVLYFFYPETSNMTLEAIDGLFTGEVEAEGARRGGWRWLRPTEPVVRADAWRRGRARGREGSEVETKDDVQQVETVDGEESAWGRAARER